MRSFALLLTVAGRSPLVMTLIKSPLGALFGALLMSSAAFGAKSITRDLTYATVGGTDLLLDVHLPETDVPAGLIVWVHGGAWRSGAKEDLDLRDLVERGWAIGSLNYRLSGEARFPAQAHDIKAAIRYLRAHADEFGYPASRFVVSGSSAGGHLAALIGVTNGVVDLEGTIGGYHDVSSDVQAVVVLFGASNLTTILQQSTPHGLSVRKPALDLLLGGQPEAVPELARLASPVFHVDADDPPMLWLHGDQDPQMPVNQGLEMQGAYEELGRPIVFKAVHGMGHGGAGFSDEAALTLIDSFLREHLEGS